MPIKSHKEDILSHINAAGTLASKVSSTNGCITLLGMIQVCYAITSDSVKITAKVHTPFGDIDLGSATLDAKHPSITLGGGAFGFKAELTITLTIKDLSLEICGKLCAPFAGCTSGCTTIHF